MTGRSMFRVLRWVGLAAVAPVLWACQARSLEAPVLKPEATFGKTFQQSINRNVDMLLPDRRFVVDAAVAGQSGTQLPDLHDDARGPANGPGLPNLHVAVISSDMGAGDGRWRAAIPPAARTASSSTPRAAAARRTR